MRPKDWEAVRAIYLEGIATGNSTFEQSAPDWKTWDQGHLPSCRLVARAGNEVLGWTALSPVSRRHVYAGVAEFSIYVVPRSGVSLEAVERAADQVITAFAQRPPALRDIERAKTQLVAKTIYRRDSQYALAAAYGEALAIGMTADDVEAWPARIRAVNGTTLLKEAKIAFDKQEAVSAYLAPKAPK